MDVDVDGFRHDGHTVVRGLGAHLDLAAMRAALAPYQQQARERLAPMAQRSTYDRAFLQMMNLWRTNDTVRAFTFDPT
ncbi:MAG: hypothetical protein RLY45_1342, partial [Actinomycetota bacterium]